MSTIPANTVINVVPSVLAAGGTGLNGTGLILTTNSRLPIGTVQSFNGPAAVNSYFGAATNLAQDCGIYFTGFQGASITPATLLMAQYNLTAVSAYLRGGNISGLSLAQLQAISGVLDILVDGYAHNAASLNLSAATSFTSAAGIIQTAINGALTSPGSVTGSIAAETASFTASISGNVMTVTAVASGTIVNGGALTGTGVTSNTTITGQLSGTAGGIGTYAVSISQIVASETLTEAYGLMTVTAVGSGALAVGQTLTGSGVTVGTIITQLDSGTGGTGTYYVNLTQTASSTTITAEPTNAVVTYDSTSGAFIITSGITGAASTIAFATGGTAATLLLTSATGAVLSQGAAPATPATFMSALIVTNSAWVNFMTHFDPDGGGGNTQKQAFAAWKNTALGGNRFGYFCWDPDASPAASSDAASSLGQILKGNGDSGTLLIWEGGATTDNGLCAFALGVGASINYGQVNGRTTFDFRAQAGLVANVTDPTTSSNLLANGYNFYAAIGTGNTNFIWFQTGQITGPYLWADSYQTAIWLNSYFQVQLLTLFANSLSVPFTQAGAALIQQACQTVINAALAFGAFAPNTLTSSQIAQVNAAAGNSNAANSLQSQGYYLQINLPNQIVQAARGPWAITFYYIDRNSVQSINLSSVLVQ